MLSLGRGNNNSSFRSGKSFNSNRERESYRDNGNQQDAHNDNRSYTNKRDFNRGDGNYKDSSNDKFTSENAKELYIPPEPSNDETEIFGTGVSAGINFINYSQIPVKVIYENFSFFFDFTKNFIIFFRYLVTIYHRP